MATLFFFFIERVRFLSILFFKLENLKSYKSLRCRAVGHHQLLGLQRRQGAVGRVQRRTGEHDVGREQPGSVQELRRRLENGEHPAVVGRTRLAAFRAHMPDPVERVLGRRQFSRRPDGRARHAGQTHR